jgi:hypothetical protein
MVRVPLSVATRTVQRMGTAGRRAAVVTWLLFAGSMVHASGVAGLCADIPHPRIALQRGGTAFVGVATYVTANYWATFHIEEVWSAGDLREWLEVAGSPQDKPFLTDLFANIGSTDRTWKAGGRYLVLPYEHGSRLLDNACTGTTEWHAGLASLRPATAHEPLAAAGPLDWVPLASGALLLVSLPFIALARARLRR